MEGRLLSASETRQAISDIASGLEAAGEMDDGPRRPGDFYSPLKYGLAAHARPLRNLAGFSASPPRRSAVAAQVRALRKVDIGLCEYGEWLSEHTPSDPDRRGRYDQAAGLVVSLRGVLAAVIPALDAIRADCPTGR